MPPDPVPWCVPDLTGSETRYLTEAIAAGQPGPSGDFLTRFETGAARLAGARHAVATCTGTAALHITFLLAGVRPGDEVIVPAWTFVATANAIRHAGGHPVALDVDPQRWQLDPAQLERFLTRHCRKTCGRRSIRVTDRPVAAVVPVDLLGHPADLAAITALAAEYEISVVEDAAQALGATCHGRPAGGSGLAAASFNANKLITAGSGGAILTSDGHTAAARYLINQARDHPVEYRHGEPGWNYRMTNLHAAVGCAQLERATCLITAKQRIYARYTSELSEITGIRVPGRSALGDRDPLAGHHRPSTAGHPHHRPAAAGRLAGDGIQAGPPWTPLHLTGAHRGCAPWPCPVAERFGRDALHLPNSVTLTEDQQNRVLAAVRAAIGQPART